MSLINVITESVGTLQYLTVGLLVVTILFLIISITTGAVGLWVTFGIFAVLTAGSAYLAFYATKAALVADTVDTAASIAMMGGENVNKTL